MKGAMSWSRALTRIPFSLILKFDLITLGQDSSPKTKYGSRRWFLRTAAASASGVILSACAPEDRALDEGKKQALEGTPTPKPESKISHELIRKNLFLLSVMSTNENEWYTYGSSGFIKGEVINRPDLIIMTTARHVMIGDDGLPRFMNTTLTFQNGITGTNCEISSEKLVCITDTEYDLAVVVFKKADVTTQGNFFEYGIDKVRNDWRGDSQVVVGGYNQPFAQGVGASVPAITTVDPQMLESPDGQGYRFTAPNSSFSPGFSGGLALDVNGSAVGVLTAMNTYGVPVETLMIAPYKNFPALVQTAAANLDNAR